ncbi:hypothetical protein [Clostridium sp. AN503]|uniref:hypothetical protein n=1 Tax=Clostridium sp. AN503 TaxID=3160598 RepID=UPI00345960C7
MTVYNILADTVINGYSVNDASDQFIKEVYGHYFTERVGYAKMTAMLMLTIGSAAAQRAVEKYWTGKVTNQNGKGEGEFGTGDKFADIENARIKSQDQLSKEYFDTLTDKGAISGGCSGEEAPLISDPNSFYKTDAGHIITYNSKGEKVLDISPERVKVWKKNVNPNNPSQVNWSSYKLKNDSGQVEKTLQWILDYFN